MTDPITYELTGRVAKITLDDGKANAIGHTSIETLHEMLDRAESEAGSVLLAGRPGRFCAGFDLGVIQSGSIDDVRTLVKAGGELFTRLYASPQPIIVACTGHAIAAGAIVLLAADTRIGVQGEFKLGLSEVSIGMNLPIFAFELARERLSKRHFIRATTQAELYGPDDAVDAGYLDRVVSPEDLLEAALEEAAQLAEVPQPAYRTTKASIRKEALEHIRTTLDADMGNLNTA
ncbi:crotonase/enoyl-CoA hydratase family protein [Myxococcota bacterium]|nr:crotonase/enoyl-CoA hydratase family protein [Myxococcota bacterium]